MNVNFREGDIYIDGVSEGQTAFSENYHIGYKCDQAIFASELALISPR